jgi:hypothetical protein
LHRWCLSNFLSERSWSRYQGVVDTEKSDKTWPCHTVPCHTMSVMSVSQDETPSHSAQVPAEVFYCSFPWLHRHPEVPTMNVDVQSW